MGTQARCEEMLARGAREKWFIFPILRVVAGDLALDLLSQKAQVRVHNQLTQSSANRITEIRLRVQRDQRLRSV